MIQQYLLIESRARQFREAQGRMTIRTEGSRAPVVVEEEIFWKVPKEGEHVSTSADVLNSVDALPWLKLGAS